MFAWSRPRYTHSFWSMFAWSHGAGFATLTVSGICLHGVMKQASLHSQFLEYVCMESRSRLRYTHSFWSMFAWSHEAGFATLSFWSMFAWSLEVGFATLTVSGVCLHGVMEQAFLHSQFLEYVCMESSWSRLRYTQFLEYVSMESWSRLRYTHSFWSMFAWSHGAGFATLTVSRVCLHGVME